MKKFLAMIFMLASAFILSACDREAYGMNVSQLDPSTSVIDDRQPTPDTQIYLMLFMWVNNQWVPGWEVPGYSPLEQESMAQCMAGAEVINSVIPQDVVLDDGTKLHVEKFRGRCFVIIPWAGKH